MSIEKEGKKKPVEQTEEDIKAREMLDILEDDDGFEEFEQYNMAGKMEDIDEVKQWYHFFPHYFTVTTTEKERRMGR